MKNNIFVRILFLIILSGLILSGCEKETVLADKVNDNHFNQLIQKYDLTCESITSYDSKCMTIIDQAVSISELESLLTSLHKLKGTTFTIENKEFINFKTPRLRSSEPENNDNVSTACVSGQNSELTATVCLDLKNETVTNSYVDFRFPSSFYLNYVHKGGYYGKSSNIVNFSAYGSVEVFVAIDDIVVTSYSVSMRGHYDLSSNQGELTFY